MPTGTGQLAQKLSVPADGTYNLWLRQISNAAGSTTVVVQMDGGCPVAAGDTATPGLFVWTGRPSGEVGKRLTFDLKAGEHTVTIVGRDAGVGVDRGFLTTDANCTPAGSGGVCNAAAAHANAKAATEAKAAAAAKTHRTIHWPVVVVCLLGGLGAVGLLVWRYVRFRPLVGQVPSHMVVGGLPRGPVSGQPKPLQFLQQNKRLVFLCGWMAVAALVLGLVFADSPGTAFEAESATLSAGARVAENTGAVGGKYVVFDTAPASSSAASGGQSGGAKQSSGGSSNAGGGSSGSQSGGGTSSGGGGSSAASCTNPKHTANGPDDMGGCWPGPNNTGVPAGTVLSNYTGPCTVTANNTVIDAKIITCDMVIQASGVQITRSKFVNGSVSNDENTGGHSFTISDSEINVGDRYGTGLESRDFTAVRLHIYGGNRSVNCWMNCSITDSYVHGQFRDNSGVAHESGIRMGESATIRHNSILCDAPEVPPDAGCSADLTGYGDFGPVQNNVIDKNLFLATLSGGFCSYGGSSQGKPYSGQTNHITFSNNIWQRGSYPGERGGFTCGYYGSNTAFDTAAPGNVWTNNKFDDGTTVNPQN